MKPSNKPFTNYKVFEWRCIRRSRRHPEMRGCKIQPFSSIRKSNLDAKGLLQILPGKMSRNCNILRFKIQYTRPICKHPEKIWEIVNAKGNKRLSQLWKQTSPNAHCKNIFFKFWVLCKKHCEAIAEIRNRICVSKCLM